MSRFSDHQIHVDLLKCYMDHLTEVVFFKDRSLSYSFLILSCLILSYLILQMRDVVEEAYHDLVSLIYFLLEAEVHEDLHEHAGFLDDIKTIRKNILSLLCRLKVVDSLNQYGISPEVSQSVVPEEVSNLHKRNMMRQRDYVIFHHLDKYLLQLERGLHTLLEEY